MSFKILCHNVTSVEKLSKADNKLYIQENKTKSRIASLFIYGIWMRINPKHLTQTSKLSTWTCTPSFPSFFNCLFVKLDKKPYFILPICDTTNRQTDKMTNINFN
jgi:hypothetical protein